jgi:hypothetical protein
MYLPRRQGMRLSSKQAEYRSDAIDEAAQLSQPPSSATGVKRTELSAHNAIGAKILPYPAASKNVIPNPVLQRFSCIWAIEPSPLVSEIASARTR